MAQLDYNDMSPAIAGMLADSGFRDIVSRTGAPNVARVERLTVTAATNSKQYDIFINGVLVSFTSDATATIQEVRDGLKAAIDAEGFLTGVVATANVSTNAIDITSAKAGTPITVSEADAELTVVNQVANVTGNPIQFGRGVAQDGANADRISLPSGTGFIFGGVAVHKQKAQRNVDSIAEYEADEAVPVLKKGRIWVWAEQAVTPVDPVFLRHTANGAALLQGQFRKDADTARADQLPDARFVSVTAGPALVALEINVP